IFELELEISDILLKIREGLIEIFEKKIKDRVLYDIINDLEINKKLIEINIFFEEIDGFEYLKFMNDFDFTKNINIYKIINICPDIYYLDEMKLKLKSINYYDLKYSPNYYIDLIRNNDNVVIQWEFILKSFKANLPGEITVKIKFDLF